MGWALAMEWLAVKTQTMAITNTLNRNKRAVGSLIQTLAMGWLLLAFGGEQIKRKAIFSVCWNLLEISKTLL
jgi:hypothetical protein